MDISGPRERNYDRLFTSRLRFEPYFSPSISRRRSSRAQYEVTGAGRGEGARTRLESVSSFTTLDVDSPMPTSTNEAARFLDVVPMFRSVANARF